MEFCQSYDSEHLVLAPRRSEEEKQIDHDPEQLILLTTKDWNMSQVRGDSMRKNYYESRVDDSHTELPNMQNVLERWNLDISISPMNLLWKETSLHVHADNTQNQ